MGKYQTSYEWVVESMVGEDVDGLEHFDNFPAALAVFNQPLDAEDTRRGLALLKHLGNDWEGRVHTGYAYVIDGVLPETFDDGTDVPLRFGNEVRRSHVAN